MPTSPSRIRFGTYRQAVRDRNRGRDVSDQPDSDLSTQASGGGQGHGGRHGHAGGDRAAAPRQRGFWELLGAFWGLLIGHRGSVVLSLALLTVAILLRLVPPYATKLAIDSVLTTPAKPLPDAAAWLLSGMPGMSADQPEPMAILVAIAIAVVVLTLIGTAIGLWSRWTATRAVNRAQVTIRRQVYEHVIQLPLQRVYDLKSGGVSSLIREDAGGIGDLIFSMLYNPWRAIVQFIGSLIILMLVDWKLMIGGLLLLPLVWITHRTWINRIRPLFRDIRKQRQAIDAGATETFGGIRVVRTFARWRNESSRFVREGDFLVRQQLFTWWWTRTVELIWEVIIPLASTGLLLYGGYQIIQGELTLGELMMFLVYLTMLLDPLATLAGSAVSFQTNLAALDRVLDVLGHPREFSDNPATVKLDRATTRGAIELRGVRFAYPGAATEVLRGIDLRVEPGETVALVGRSGAGKTTLTNLIARFYDPTAGSVLVDGQDLRDVDVQSYRKLLGIVEQDVFLFDGTIAENISYARPTATEAECIAAAEAAAAHEFIVELPKGYATRIGERGFKLSGGQRQRIAIARALLADPKILILDEATSNLDSHSERLIQRSLAELLHGRTAFVIAHRLSTIRGADKIVVIQDGEIVQVGNHEELLAQPGRYREMIRLQTADGQFPADTSDSESHAESVEDNAPQAHGIS